jgi:parallel beta-helix repeat protein
MNGPHRTFSTDICRDRSAARRFVARHLGLVAAIVLLATYADAATYYVSPSGNDANSCTSAQSTIAANQKATVSAGVACLAAGDTLLIHGGTYTGTKNVIDSQTYKVASGTSWSTPVTIANVPGETVVLRPPNNVSGIRLTTGAPSYIVFQGFTIDMVNSTSSADADGIFLYTAHHNRFQDMEVMHAPNFGVHFAELTPFNQIVNSRIHDTGYPNSPSTNGHGLYITGSDNLFEGNEVYNNQGYGFHIYNNHGTHDDPSRNIIRNNKIYGNGVHGSPAYAVVITWGSDNLVYNNLVYGNRGGIQVYSGSTNTGIYNNTIYGNNDEGIVMQYYGTGATIRNNIVYANGTNIQDWGGAAAPTLDHNLMTDPAFQSAAGGDFSLTSTSRAIDAGATISLFTTDIANAPRPQGSAYDIGAYEYRTNQAPTAVEDLHIVQR